MVGLALAEKRLGLESWSEHATVARRYVEKVREHSISFGTWPNINLNFMQAQIAAIEGDTDRVVRHMQIALDQHELQHTFVEHSPFMAELRNEPRLLGIAEQMRERALAERVKLEAR